MNARRAAGGEAAAFFAGTRAQALAARPREAAMLRGAPALKDDEKYQNRLPSHTSGRGGGGRRRRRRRRRSGRTREAGWSRSRGPPPTNSGPIQSVPMRWERLNRLVTLGKPTSSLALSLSRPVP